MNTAALRDYNLARMNELENIVKEVLVPYGVKRAYIFGSVARGEENPQSDLDMLLVFERPVGLLAIARIERELSERLGRTVEVVTEGALSPLLRAIVEKERVLVYAKG